MMRAADLIPADPSWLQLDDVSLLRALRESTGLDLAEARALAQRLSARPDGCHPTTWHEAADLLRREDPVLVEQALADAPDKGMKRLRAQIEGLPLSAVAHLYRALGGTITV